MCISTSPKGVFRRGSVERERKRACEEDSSVYGYYQLLSQHADTEGGFPSNQYDLGADYGRTVNDTRTTF